MVGKERHYMVESYLNSEYPQTYYNEYTGDALMLWGVDPITPDMQARCLMNCKSGKIHSRTESAKIIEYFMAER